MNNSENNLTQHAYTAAHAVIPTTTNVGTLRKIVNNAVNILSGAKIASKKDVDIDYRASGPIENLSSVLENIHQYYIAFGYTTNTKSENKYSDHNPSLKLDGDIIAGQGNNRYMKISSDGKIDFQKGFSSQEYILSDGDPADGEALQNNTVKFLENKISELNKRIEELENNIDKGNVIISEISSLISDANAMLDEINSLDLKTEDEFNALILDYYKNTVKQALIDNGDVDSSGNVSLDYETIINAYAAYIVGLDTQPNADTPVVLPTITEFLNSHDTYKNLHGVCGLPEGPGSLPAGVVSSSRTEKGKRGADEDRQRKMAQCRCRAAADGGTGGSGGGISAQYRGIYELNDCKGRTWKAISAERSADSF